MMYIFAFVHLHIWHLHICTLTKGDHLHIYILTKGDHLHICIFAHLHINQGRPFVHYTFAHLHIGKSTWYFYPCGRHLRGKGYHEALW